MKSTNKLKDRREEKKMKKYLFKSIITSPYGVRTLYMCSDKKVLENFLNDEIYSNFVIGEIVKSKRYFCTDKNTEIHSISLS